MIGSCTRFLPWFLLLCVASTSAYGLQLTAAAITKSTAGAQVDMTKFRDPTVQDTVTTATHKLLITGLDIATGDRVSVQCTTATDRIAIEVLVVELMNLGDIAAQFCSESNAPVLGPEAFY